jgi:nucleoside phosphorylase
MKSVPALQLSDATVGVITALDEEFVAAQLILGCDQEIIADRKTGRTYSLGRLKSRGDREHVVALCKSTMGNNMAASRATDMTHECKSIEHIVMVGIAGGIPNSEKWEDHVRLGDIIVSDDGVVQYDFIKKYPHRDEAKSRHRPPSAALVSAVGRLNEAELRNKRPWETFIDDALQQLDDKWKRPAEKLDVLKDVWELPGTSRVVKTLNRLLYAMTPRTLHPAHPKRVTNRPLVFHGPIASANMVLKDYRKRNLLRNTFGVKAVEMEGSGIADATWSHAIGYIVVRSSSDYGNSGKNDVWRYYAAVAAAAYARALIEALPSTLESPVVRVEYGPPLAAPSSPVTIDRESFGLILEKQEEIGRLKEQLRSASTGSAQTSSVAGREETEAYIASAVKQALRVPSSTPGVKDASAAKVSPTPATETTGQPTTTGEELIVEKGLDLHKRMMRLSDTYDYAESFNIMDELERWLHTHEDAYSTEQLKSLYGNLARIATVQAQHNAPVGTQPDFSKARQLLQRGKNATRRDQ